MNVVTTSKRAPKAAPEAAPEAAPSPTPKRVRKKVTPSAPSASGASGASAELSEPKQLPYTTELLLSVDQAARKLGVGRSLTYKLIFDGVLPSLMVGRFRRVPLADLEQYIASGLLAERQRLFGRSA
ncbi:MAG TPA: excisionase family DNA-binding protein [Ktedonobacterales bacterium]|nr:excisionase family DNA-binding protein [Ktedonobacterales bacterium]